MLKRCRHIIVLAGCISFLGLLAWIVFAHPREPSYEGRTLSSWLNDVAGSGFSIRGQLVLTASARDGAAIDAVRHMGPEAYPLLIEMLKSEDGRIKKFILGMLGKQRSRLGLLTADEKRLRARTTLAFLGNQAAAAWKQILLDPAITQDVRQLAIYQCLTPPEDAGRLIPAMVRLIAELQPDWRDPACSAIRRFGPDAALPVLARQMLDPDWNIQFMTMRAIKYFGSSARPLSQHSCNSSAVQTRRSLWLQLTQCWQ
jgi:HEAT repeat protein